MWMFRRFPLLAVSFAFLLCGASAQQTVTLGNATVALNGPWKFHTGDDPAWAQPDYDDSAWDKMDLTLPPVSYDPNGGTNGWIPGWTSRGYKDSSGYAWYRLRVNIQNGQSGLALKMPEQFDDAYQVYVNGQLVGQFGRFTPHGVTFYENQPRVVDLPRNVRNGAATIAVRMWMSPDTPFNQHGAGGLHEPPVLGQTSVVRALTDLFWYRLEHVGLSVSLSVLVNLVALLVAFALFWLDRSELAYLWLGLQCTQSLLYGIFGLIDSYTTWMSGPAVTLLLTAVLGPLGNGLVVIFWATWFRTARMGLLHRAVWSIVALLGVAVAMTRAPLYGMVVSFHANIWLLPLIGILEALFALLLLRVTYLGIRKKRVEGLLALAPVLLVVVSWYGGRALYALHVQTSFYFFGIAFPLPLIATYVALAIVTILMLRRFLQTQREREHWKLEIEQARQVQQVLIPEALASIPGFHLESDFRPAQRVGGDFFQIIEAPGESLLIVLGDVTGHGLKAAMMVSLIVGAIRTETAHGNDPLTLLRALNQRLYGRGDVYATCFALRIDPQGNVELANAGHLPPYLNGEEMELAGALPLGMVADAEFSTMSFLLRPGDTLLMMTDGVAEAQDAQGQQFGFDRIARMAQQTVSAAEMASAAQTFGQQDDITVLRVVRDRADAPIAAGAAFAEASMD
jgi:Stage II sporulation protein E (SpoIIE)